MTADMTAGTTAATPPALLEWNPARGFSPLDPARPFPMGLLYSYSVFTTFRTPVCESALQAHLKRLATHSDLLGLDCPLGEELRQALLKTAFFHEPDLVIRLTVFADVADWHGLLDSTRTPIPSRLLCRVSTAPPWCPPEPIKLLSFGFEKPMTLIKHGSLAPCFKMQRQARQRGFDEALWVNPHEHLAETATANIFALRKRTLYTPDILRDGCLQGITRQNVLEAAPALGLKLSKQPLCFQDRNVWDAVFVSNAVQGLRRVSHIDDIALPWPESACRVFEQLKQSLDPIIQPHPHTAAPR